jgi:Pyruvate/2-oxoacid:ferredoxin oxidoreductase gamma subunit
MEREILMSGIGGQGVQLAAKALATAAMREGRRVLMFGTYGGAMRGGDTDATVVIGEDSLDTPPVVDAAWAGIAMHHKGWAGLKAKLRPGGLLLVDATVFLGDAAYDGAVLRLGATGLAAEANMPQGGAMVALGAFARATGIVSLDTLIEISESVLPPYRRQFAKDNRAALALGHEAVESMLCAAWAPREQAA